MNDYKRLTNEELYDFTSRVVVQLNPTLTQQVTSLILELSEYRTKIENGTLIELGKPYIRQLSMIPQQDKYIICKATEKVIAGAFTKAEVEARLKELQGE